MTHSVPLDENERQRSINDICPFINGNQTAMHLSLWVYNVLTVFLRHYGHELFVASLHSKSVVTVQEAVMGMFLAYLPREAADSSLTEVCNHAPLILPKVQDLKSLTII